MRITVFFPLLIGAFGWFQYYGRTCVRLAFTGQRELDSGSERVTDTAELHAIRRQALRVQLQSVFAAVAVTAIYLATS